MRRRNIGGVEPVVRSADRDREVGLPAPQKHRLEFRRIAKDCALLVSQVEGREGVARIPLQLGVKGDAALNFGQNATKVVSSHSVAGE